LASAGGQTHARSWGSIRGCRRDKKGYRLPLFRLNAYLGLGRGVKAFLNLEGGVTRGPLPDAEKPKKGRTGKPGKQKNRKKDRPGKHKNRNRAGGPGSKNDGSEQTPDYAGYTEKIESKKQELRRTKEKQRIAELAANESAGLAERMKVAEHRKKKRMVSQEIFRLQRERQALQEGWVGDGPVTGALPDFLVIGVGKGGTTFLYHLLTQHPLVERASSKEVHFFDNRFELGVEWYRHCFPTPRQKNGRMTITGEASPYIAYPPAPERAAEVVPEARLIALLRNPVDRAYSRYQQMVRRGRVTRSFEEIVEKEKTLLLGAPESGEERERYFDKARESSESWNQALYKGIYVEHLARWSEHFDREQMLILKSEDFFARPREVLQQVFGFLGLPGWEPDPSVFESKRNSRKYEKMSPETRRHLEEFFAPHNRRLYDYLGRDFGW
jgi:hypothetical protein